MHPAPEPRRPPTVDTVPLSCSAHPATWRCDFPIHHAGTRAQWRTWRLHHHGSAPGVERCADEIVRWVSPAKHFMRTAQADTELAGARIAKND